MAAASRVHGASRRLSEGVTTESGLHACSGGEQLRLMLEAISGQQKGSSSGGLPACVQEVRGLRSVADRHGPAVWHGPRGPMNDEGKYRHRHLLSASQNCSTGRWVPSVQRATGREAAGPVAKALVEVGSRQGRPAPPLLPYPPSGRSGQFAIDSGGPKASHDQELYRLFSSLER